ncbi:MAG: class I SAM-dependent methyltransferase [Cyanobacteria bacterium J06623_4]
MNDQDINIPSAVEQILSETDDIEFQMTSELSVGALLQTLAASKPAGHFLELGTGTGVATAWLASGMDAQSKLVTVENDSAVAAIAQKYLDNNLQISFHVEDAAASLEHIEQIGQQFDLIFADTWTGKYTHLERVLDLLKPGGLYVIDDMLPQENWPEGHDVKVAELVKVLESNRELLLTKLNWASGIIIAAKRTVY